jgi:S-DNA-T family DNA segregation ATPase FtsK/SpoIIIE
MVLIIGCAIFLLLALLSHSNNDPGWSRTGIAYRTVNIGGLAGAWFSDILFCLFGYLAYLFPGLLGLLAWRLINHDSQNSQKEVIASGKSLFLLWSCAWVMVILSSCGLADLHFIGAKLSCGAGGVFGSLFQSGMVNLFSLVGAKLILLVLLLTGLVLCSEVSLVTTVDFLGRHVLKMIDFIGDQIIKITQIEIKGGGKVKIEQKYQSMETKVEQNRTPVISQAPAIKISHRDVKERQTNLLLNSGSSSSCGCSFILPPLALLDKPEPIKEASYNTKELEEISRNVELRLDDFGIEAQVVAVHPGPVVTRFELQLAAGTKVSRITTLAKDLARSLSVISVRIVEIIPGKSVIGLELPNVHREVVRLREILASQQYENSRAPLALALGKDISGYPVIVDLSKMPHLLVAGTTGSGKSVCLNALLLSLLYKYSPQDLRLILIDPKMLELSVYADIPHLLAPVVTDMKESVNAFKWCVAEMERRYRLMATLGVRNLSGYNHKIKEAQSKGTPLFNPFVEGDSSQEPQELQKLPYIVVLADEYADMMMVVGKKVEELIARIAQKARAAGIHLILATQRPSVDVITGLIKANIPTRIAFQVSSKIDSRTILDQGGAEQLLGFGDMLYLPPGSGIPVRIHGAFVADEEVHRVVGELKNYGKPEYLEEIIDDSLNQLLNIDSESSGQEFSDAEQDPLYDQAVAIVLESRRASVSSIQRRLKIGYNRAARIVEAMEVAGLVGPMENNGNREILVSSGNQE